MIMAEELATGDAPQARLLLETDGYHFSAALPDSVGESGSIAELVDICILCGGMRAERIEACAGSKYGKDRVVQWT